MFSYFWNGSLGLGFKVSGFGRIQAEASLAVTEFGRGTSFESPKLAARGLDATLADTALESAQWNEKSSLTFSLRPSVWHNPRMMHALFRY